MGSTMSCCTKIVWKKKSGRGERVEKEGKKEETIVLSQRDYDRTRN